MSKSISQTTLPITVWNMPTDEIKQILMDRLEKIGMDLCLIPGFIKSLKNYLLHNSPMNLFQVNEKLHYLGWGDLALDYHTLQLAIEYFEANDLNTSIAS